MYSPSLTQLSSQPRLGPDVREPLPGVTAGTRHMFQALGGPDGTSAVPPTATPLVDQGFRAPLVEQLGSAFAPPPQSVPAAAPPPSTASASRPPPPGLEVPPSQPLTSSWVPSGPPPSRSAPDSRTSSESEASDVSVHDSASSRLADLIYEVCPDSRPPRCGFEPWFGQPEVSASRQRFRLYPRVAKVESEVAARTVALARLAKPLSHVLPSRSRRCAVADDPLFASSLPVNPSFA